MVNETKTLTLSQFIKDRLAEREEIALAAAGWDRSGSKRANGQWIRVGISSVDGEDRQSVIYSDSGQVSESVADHVAANDPAFVLEDIMSKRAIVDLHTGYHDCPELRTGTYPDDWPETATWGKAGESWQHPSSEYFVEGEPCPTLRLLAAPYRRHADFQEAWA